MSSIRELALARAIGGGGGGEISVQSLSVTENGRYTAPSGKAYTPVNVNVPQISVESLSVTENGTYTAPGGKAYSPVNVNVPERQPVTEPLSVTQNGTYTPGTGVDGFSSVSVNVSGGASGVYVGADAPDPNIGSNGEYYYRRHDFGNGFNGELLCISSTKISGYEFIPNKNIIVLGLRGYVRYNAVGRLSIVETSGVLVAEITDLSFAQGWNVAFFETPVQLAANQNYIVMIEVSSNVLSYGSASNAIFDSAITYVQGRYGSIPGTNDNGVIYGADIIIQTDYSVVYEQYYKTNGSWSQIV